MSPRTLKLLLLAIVLASVAVSLLILRRRRKEIVLASFSLLLCLAGFELFLKTLYPVVSENQEMFTYDPELGWAFVPDTRGAVVYPGEAHHFIQTNAMGFRDGPLPPPDAGTLRIMVLGDSFVANIAVEDRDVFTEVLERRLDGASVMNFGVSGYAQVQEYLLLAKIWKQVKPDRVILVVYLRNDFLDNVQGDWFYPGPVAVWNGEDSTLSIRPPPPRSKASPDSSRWRWYRRSQVYSLLDRGLQTLMDRFVAAGDQGHQPSIVTPPELYLCRKELSEETSAMYRTMEALLLKISGLLEAQGIPYLFVLAPSRVQVEEGVWSHLLEEFGEDRESYEPSLPNDRLMAFAGDHSLPMLDLLPPLRSEVKKGRALYFPNEEHWTPDGNRAVAEILLASSFVRDLGR